MSILDSIQFRYHRWCALREASRELPAATAEERAEIAELRRSFSALPEAPTTGVSANEADWNGAMNRLRELGSSADPRTFQRWDVITARMAHVSSPATRVELDALQYDQEWSSRWREAILEVPAGCPNRYSRYRESSEVLIQTAYHTRALERLSNRRVNEWDVVVEFGGGFGGLCRLIHKLGFTGRYFIFDLPPFTLLQRYYLDKTGVSKNGRCTMSSDWSELEAFVESIAPSEKAVLWATWSLSEAPLDVRERIKPLAEKIGHYCIAYQGEYGDVDNAAWFAHSWLDGARVLTSIGHRKDDYYLAGRTSG